MIMDETKMPIGTPVIVHRDNGDRLKTHTRSAPWLMGGHSWVVQVEGIAGCYALSHISIVHEPVGAP